MERTQRGVQERRRETWRGVRPRFRRGAIWTDLGPLSSGRGGLVFEVVVLVAGLGSIFLAIALVVFVVFVGGGEGGVEGFEVVDELVDRVLGIGGRQGFQGVGDVGEETGGEVGGGGCGHKEERGRGRHPLPE